MASKEYTADELSDLLVSWGVQARMIGVTPYGLSRSDEIHAWLNKAGRPDLVEAFVILDDMTDMGTSRRV